MKEFEKYLDNQKFTVKGDNPEFEQYLNNKRW